MAENIREEIRRLNRRKQLSFHNTNGCDQMQDSESSGSEMGMSPRRPESPPAHVRNPETALFTFKQVRSCSLYIAYFMFVSVLFCLFKFLFYIS